MNKKINLLIILFITNITSISLAQDIYDMNLEELMDIEVSTVNKKSSSLMKSAASIYVVTKEEIKMKGARNVPEALRGVPGLHVAQINQTSWAIASRGFNGRFANKLLVLIDGRAVYLHTFSGVYWDELEVDINEIERIEVIKGPGGTLWGANAFSGIVNIITKDSKSSKGLKFTTASGSELENSTSLRYGGKINDKSNFKIWSNYTSFENAELDSGNDARDSYKKIHLGTRIDTDNGNGETNSLQLGYTNTGNHSQNFLPTGASPLNSLEINNRNRESNSTFILNKWRKEYSNRSDIEFQFFYDRRRNKNELIDETTNRIDFEFKKSQPFFGQHDILWGMGYRYISDDLNQLEDVSVISYNPASNKLDTFNAFLQTDFKIIPNTLQVSVGTKLEHNDFTGFEFQPSIRALYTPSNNFTLWGAVSRAIRTPSRSETAVNATLTGINIPGVGPLQSTLEAQNNLDAEVSYTYEMGFRYLASSNWSFDISTFYSKSSELFFTSPGMIQLNTNSFPPSPYIPINFQNIGAVDNYGAEAVVDFVATKWLNFRASYSHIKFHSSIDNPGTNNSPIPENMINLRASIQLPNEIDADLNYRFMDSLGGNDVEAYSQLDLRLAKNITKNILLELVGRNLLHERQPEFFTAIYTPIASSLEREFFARITWVLG